MHYLYILFAIAAGAGVAFQAVFNTRLRFVLGAPVWAAMTQFLVGLALLALLAAVTRPGAPHTSGLGRVPWWMWTGGIFGATFIMMGVIVTPRLGAAVMLASTILGQLGAALLVDHFGWFGSAVVPISVTRVLGVALLALGVILIRWP